MEISLQLRNQEESIINAAVRREKWAQKLIYEEFFGSMMGVCMRYARDDNEALDLLHDGFLKVFKNMSKYQPGTSLQSWIKRIMVNTCIDHFRKVSKRRTDELDEATGVTDGNPDAVSRLGEKEVLEALQSLSPIYRAVFNLYVIEGYSHREIGNQLGITESTSRSNLVKARAKLRLIIAQHNGDE